MKTSIGNTKKMIYQKLDELMIMKIYIILEIQKGIGATLYLTDDTNSGKRIKQLSPPLLKIRELNLFLEGFLEGTKTKCGENQNE